ncbi:MAG: penicillin-binding protein 2 [Gammaproteobacteria bacterium]|nr:MAG: penicillin-binding protein 2 [Gammaproteobacteria bacterium]
MAADNTLKDPQREARIFKARALLVVVLMLICLGALVARYYSLQITHHAEYVVQSDRNRLQLQSIAPKRGLIYDRNGVLLAENRPSFLLSIVIERTPNLEDTLNQLRKLLPLEETDVVKFYQRMERRTPYEAVPLRFKLTDEERAVLAVNRHRLPGVSVEAQLLRYYPQGDLFAHAVGYVGRINEREAALLDEVDYRGTFHIGKTGIEKFYEDRLHGEVGYQNVEVNAHGRVLRVLERHDPIPGEDLTLHLDIALQKVATEALGDRRGAVVAIDPKTGGVLALVSTPAFDANLFVNGISTRDYSALRDSIDVPLFNRAVQGQYPPGSTVKPFMGMAGLAAKLIDAEFTVPDPGWYKLPGDKRLYRDWVLRYRGTGHAPQMNLVDSIAESCDVFFYDLAKRLTIDGMYDRLHPYGFGERTGIDTTGERRGVLPSSQWKEAVRGQVWFPGETLSAGIGQGYMLSTPTQLAAATAVLANRGVRIQPRMLHLVNREALPPVLEKSVAAPVEHWDLVYEGMVAVVHGKKGTAKNIGEGITYQMAGKTGTAQVVGIAQNAVYNEEEVAERHRHHGWFIAFAPVDDPAIAVAVLVENGGGSAAATPVARTVIDAWLVSQGVVLPPVVADQAEQEAAYND